MKPTEARLTPGEMMTMFENSDDAIKYLEETAQWDAKQAKESMAIFRMIARIKELKAALATERAARERAEADTRRLDKIEAGKIEIAHFDHDGNRPPWACGPGEDWTARGNTIREAIDAATEAGESIQSSSPPPPNGPS
jgi:hypothetical protein